MSVAEASSVQYASLYADQMCGDGTRYIYYMSLGEVLGRTFTPHDTHTARGELVVAYTSAHRVDQQHARRVLGSTAILGFESPCFTYGTDLILPVEINGRLRAVLKKNQEADDRRGEGQGLDETDAFRYLASTESKNLPHVTIYIPEVCLSFDVLCAVRIV